MSPFSGGNVQTFIRASALLALLCVGAASAADQKDQGEIVTVPDAAPAPTRTATAPMVIYDTALQSGWQNWSWAKTQLSLEVPGSARKPIKVEAGPWQALYLQHEAISTAGYTKLHMLIQGTAPDGLVRILGVVNGKPVGEGHPVKLSNTGWTRVVTPLAELGIENQSIDGLWVQNASASELPKFYVTEIRLE